jgi:hypothetical protein
MEQLGPQRGHALKARSRRISLRQHNVTYSQPSSTC